MSARLIPDMPAAEYHADPCEVPSLSSSIARVLCSSSPLHAWHSHPRLNPAYAPVEAEHFDIGTVVHAALLGEAIDLEVVVADDWRTKAAKEARDAAREAGKIPLLERQAEELSVVVAKATAQIVEHPIDPPLLNGGLAEPTILWNEYDEHPIECRARLDFLRHDFSAIDDVKTTGRSANPDEWGRSIFGLGYDVRAAFYLRAVEALTEGRERPPAFRWIVIETNPPYGLSVVSPAPSTLALGEKKVDYAMAAWRRAMMTGVWPGYPDRVSFVELPPWEETRWLDKEERELA